MSLTEFVDTIPPVPGNTPATRRAAGRVIVRNVPRSEVRELLDMLGLLDDDEPAPVEVRAPSGGRHYDRPRNHVAPLGAVRL